MANTSARPADELEIAIAEVSDGLKVKITLLEAQKVPYSTFEILGINNYQIMDKNGKAVLKGAETAAVAINNGQVELTISLEEVPAGEYKLVVTELVGGSKADQPLVLNGTWECGFTKGE